MHVQKGAYVSRMTAEPRGFSLCLRVGMLPGENCMKSFNKENLASSNMNSLNELIQE